MKKPLSLMSASILFVILILGVAGYIIDETGFSTTTLDTTSGDTMDVISMDEYTSIVFYMGSDDELYFAVFNTTDGSIITSETQIAGVASNKTNKVVDAARLNASDAVVVWSSDKASWPLLMYYAIVDTSGNIIQSSTEIETADKTFRGRDYPRVAAFNASRFIITSMNASSGAEDAYMIVYNRDGNITAEKSVDDISSKHGPDVVALNDTYAVVTWTDDLTYDVRYHVVNNLGNVTS